MPAPTGADMEKAKLLYVTLKMDYTSNPDVPNVDALKSALSDGGLTKVWAGVAGLRHKYFVYDKEEEVCSGVYVFYTEKALTDYMESDLFKAQSTYPHVSKVTAASPLTHTPPLTPCLTHTPPRLEGYGGGQGRDARHRAGHREDGLGAHAPHARRRERRQAAHRRPHHGLHDRRGGCHPPPPARPTPFHPSPPSSSPSPAPPTPIHTPHPPFSSPSSAGLPTKKEELYGFMAAPPNGMGYPAQFGTLEGLRGKYFAYDAALGHCYGFYTFVDQASLDKCVAPDPRPPPPSSGVPHPSQWRASPRQVRGVQPSPS